MFDPGNPAVDPRAPNALPSYYAGDDITETKIVDTMDICGPMAGISRHNDRKICLAVPPGVLRVLFGTAAGATGWRLG